MKLILFLILSLFSFQSFSMSESCYLFELKGTVKSQKDHLELWLAEGSQSEVKIQVPSRVQSKFFPYMDHFIQAEVVLKHKSVNRDSKIVSIQKVERAAPDPLNAGAGKVAIFRKAIKCQ